MEYTRDGPVLEVRVDYALSFNEMVRAGKYDEVNSNITARHFPVKGKDNMNVKIELVQFSLDMSSEQVLIELFQTGLRPALIEELLAVGVLYPELQRQFPIVELGSVWRQPEGGRSVAYLVGNVHKRGLYLTWWSTGWLPRHRFIVVR